jgi:hypothetical protein
LSRSRSGLGCITVASRRLFLSDRVALATLDLLGLVLAEMASCAVFFIISRRDSVFGTVSLVVIWDCTSDEIGSVCRGLTLPQERT